MHPQAPAPVRRQVARGALDMMQARRDFGDHPQIAAVALPCGGSGAQPGDFAAQPLARAQGGETGPDHQTRRQDQEDIVEACQRVHRLPHRSGAVPSIADQKPPRASSAGG